MGEAEYLADCRHLDKVTVIERFPPSAAPPGSGRS